jgi:hypothetical protein
VGDQVCVPFDRFDQVQEENRRGGSRKALETYDSGTIKGLRVGPGPTGGTIDGHARLQLSPNGNFTYTGRLDSRMTIARDVTTVCTLPLRGGDALAFIHKGRVNGTINVLKSQTHTWNKSGTTAEVYNNWPRVVSGARPVCQSHDSIPVGDIIKRTTEIGKMVGSVIKIFV